MKISNYFVLVFSLFLCISCAKKEEKKPEEKSKEQVVDTLQTNAIKTPEKVKPTLVFTVQVGAFKKVNSTLEKLSDVQVSQEAGLHKYRLQSFESYKDARNYKKSILAQYPDAFIQAVKNGKPIAIKEALN